VNRKKRINFLEGNLRQEFDRDMKSSGALFCAVKSVSLSAMQISTHELKSKIIESLKLQDITPEQIDDDAPLFGTGLGLDSIDALELVVLLEKDYGIVIKDIEEGRPAFRSVKTLAEFIAAKRPQ
jgi:acyl carrier protein